MLGEDATDALDALDNGRFARGRAVLREQEFEHVGGDDRVALDLADQVLADDEAVVCARGDFLVLCELSSLAARDQERGRGILALKRVFGRDAHRSNPPNAPNPLSLRVSSWVATDSPTTCP